MFFNFFKKEITNQAENEISEENDDILASVTYLVKRGSKSVVIDVEMDDYNEESASALCKIIDVLSEDFTYIETINIIQAALLNNKQESLLLKIYTNISPNSRDKILIAKKDSKKDEPCIKPSDML